MVNQTVVNQVAYDGCGNTADIGLLVELTEHHHDLLDTIQFKDLLHTLSYDEQR